MQDKMVEVDQAQELSELAENLFQLFIIPDAGHNDVGTFEA